MTTEQIKESWANELVILTGCHILETTKFVKEFYIAMESYHNSKMPTEDVLTDTIFANYGKGPRGLAKAITELLKSKG